VEDLLAVTFHFGPEFEVHYVSHVPEVGDRVTHASAVWVVACIENDASGVIARCELHPNGGANGSRAFYLAAHE
jgi:hypothetical protein